jgi:hypothetical protein
VRAGNKRRYARRDTPAPRNQPVEDLLQMWSRRRRPSDDRSLYGDPRGNHRRNHRRNRPDEQATPAG